MSEQRQRLERLFSRKDGNLTGASLQQPFPLRHPKGEPSHNLQSCVLHPAAAHGYGKPSWVIPRDSSTMEEKQPWQPHPRPPLRAPWGFPRCSSIEEGHFSFTCHKISTLWTFLMSQQIFPLLAILVISPGTAWLCSQSKVWSTVRA